MPVTNITTVWSCGTQVWQDSTGAEIGYWDGINRKFVITSGAVFDFSAATGSVSFAAGEISSTDIAAATIASSNLAALCVNSCHLVDTCVDTSKIADAQVTSPKIGAATIESSNYAGVSIDSSHIAALAINTTNLNDAAVTSPKIAAATIDSCNYAGASVDSSHIAAGTIASSNISPKFGKMVTGTISVATSSSGVAFAWDNPSTGTIILDGFWLARDVACAATSGQLAAGVAVTSSDYAADLINTVLNSTVLAGGLVGTTSFIVASATAWVTGWVDDGSSGFSGDYYLRYFEMTT